MIRSVLSKFMLVLAATAFVLTAGTAVADTNSMKTHLVIQVSTDDPRTQMIALNNAVNVQKAIPGAVVEIVAYGPGLGMLTGKSKQKDRVMSMALSEGISFSACGNTMKKVAKKSGKMPALIDGVKVVPAGVTRIMELQANGYAYVRP
ncbi:MAG: hypothetical protein HOE62_19010 [Alphaproteobacteria bacterium]|jgi:uncharacterized protein|nr:hypothetical protein [Alphaproteobacteria bacterium]MBT4020052.1 hypothetical protein [Alphaproteobacteria bacterium]MBT5161894.1 hypothetical protein [Alphaproteobacteria bacterium]MBT7744122.1 hypothetical protein [Alphaproteobacteria bacterium]